MSEHSSPAGRGLTRFARRLRMGVVLWSTLITAALGVGAGAVCLALSGAVAGLSPSAWLTGLCWALTATVAAVAALRAWADVPRLRGAAVAEVLRGVDDGLASDARSALELLREPSGSSELVEALTRSVGQRAGSVRAARVTRPSAHKVKLAAGTLLGGALLLSTVAATHRGQAGLYALTHPAWGGGAREGTWVEHFELRVDPPAHTGLPTRHYRDPEALDVHAGSRLSLRLREKLDVASARIVIGELELGLRAQQDGSGYRAEWIAEAEGPLYLEGYDDGWLRDAHGMRLHVIADEPPRAVLSSPAEDQRVNENARVSLSFEAHDDHGLAGVDLIVRGPGSQEHRQRVAAPESGERKRSLSGEMVLRPSDFDVRPGDTLSLWFEASDLNQHVGPQIGHSSIRTLSIEDDETREGEAVETLTKAREQALTLLADRLEGEVTRSDRRARRQFATREDATREWLKTLERAADESDGDTTELLRSMQRRVRSNLTKESRLYTSRTGRSERTDANEAAITALEGDTLWLADLLARARIEDAEAVLEQIHQAEQRMRALLEELSSVPDEARRQALMAEVARMRAKLGELMNKLRDVRGTVPAEFVNREAMQASPQQDALGKLEDAVKGNDLENARAALDALAQQLEQLEQGLGETGVALSAARFSPRNDATAQTLQQLSDLEQAQRSLSEQTDQVAREAASRGGAESGARKQAQALSKQAQRLADSLSELGEQSMSGGMAEARATAEQRLRDVADSLQSGDFFEGERMARSAASELHGLSRELEMDARMFPGADGKLQEVARNAERMRQQAEEFAQEVAESAPDLDKALEDGDRKKIRQQSVPQSELARDTHAARERMAEATGDDGVSAGAAERLSDVEDAMREASDAMRQGHLRDAQAHQRDAMQRMAQLREDLGRQSQAGGSGQASGGSRAGREGHGQGERDERVDIPEDADANRRSALRRRVLDAQRGEVPPGYEQVVERYYEEILR